jgi:hypothetical protein
MSVPQSVHKAINEGKKKVKSCPPVRAMLANESLHPDRGLLAVLAERERPQLGRGR